VCIYTFIHYITLHYIALHYITLHCIELHYIVLHCIALHYITLYYIALHYITLHCIAFHYITLHCITCKDQLSRGSVPLPGHLASAPLSKCLWQWSAQVCNDNVEPKSICSGNWLNTPQWQHKRAARKNMPHHRPQQNNHSKACQRLWSWNWLGLPVGLNPFAASVCASTCFWLRGDVCVDASQMSGSRSNTFQGSRIWNRLDALRITASRLRPVSASLHFVGVGPTGAITILYCIVILILAILDPLHPLGHCWNKPCPEGNASYDPRIAAPQPRIRRKRCRRERSAGSNHHEDTTNWGCFCTHYHLLGVWSSWCCNMLHLMCWRSNESNLQLGITWALASGYPACTQNQSTRIKESPWKSIQSTSWLEKPTEKFQHRKGGTRSLLWEVETRSWKSRAISPVNAAKRREHSEHH
jgi:hypothetical protein